LGEKSIARSQALKKYAGHTSEVSAEDPTLFKIGTMKMEINELLGQFVGDWAKTAFTVLLGAFIYITLWSYSAVFSSSLVSLVPFPGVSMGYVCDIYSPVFPAPCERSYLLYMLLFLLIVSPLICMDLTEQVGLQIFLCIFRFGAILIMFVTSVIAMYHTPYSRNDQGSPPYISFRTAVDLSGFGTIFPTAIFSQLLHHSIPGLVQPVKQKGWVRSMFSAALTTTFSLYLALGIPAVMYFGNGVKPVISLNWKDYSGLGFDGPEQAPVIAKIISYIVVLFPVLDIVSAFPLNGITLANTMFASLPAKFTNNGTSQWVKIATRLAVVFPPIILGSFVKRLDLIIEIAGTVGFFIAFIVPALLQIFSVRRARTYLGRTDTPYSIPLLSHPILAVLVVIFGLGSFIFQCVNIGMRIHDGSLKM
jgi:hypothetical protein